MSDQRIQERRAKTLALPVVEWDGGPVYVDDYDRFYFDGHDAAVVLIDEGRTLADVIVHPCSEGRAAVPDLFDHVDEAFAEQFEDGEFGGMSERATAAIRACEQVLREEAPRLWIPNRKVRVVLPLPPEYDPTQDTEA